MMGGEWEQATRHLRVMAGPWIQPRDITYHLMRLDKAAKAVDKLETQNNLILLNHAINDLNRSIRNYAHQLEELARHVADYIGAVHQASLLAAKNPTPVLDPEPEMITQAQYEALGVDRLAALYSIPKPRNYRPKK
jgi:hypothetical protein